MKWMNGFTFEEKQKRRERWRRWFAWYPVTYTTLHGKKLKVWLEVIERKEYYDDTTDYEWEWIYRLLET